MPTEVTTGQAGRLYRKDNSAQVGEHEREECFVRDIWQRDGSECGGKDRYGIWRRSPWTRFRLGAEKTENRRHPVYQLKSCNIPQRGQPQVPVFPVSLPSIQNRA